MSHPNALAASFKDRFHDDGTPKPVASRSDVKAQLDALRYRNGGFQGAAETAVTAAGGGGAIDVMSPAVVEQVSAVQVRGQAINMTQDEIAQTVAKTLATRMQSTADAHDHLLDEENSLSTVVQFKYTFRKAQSQEEKAVAKKSAEKIGKVYVDEAVPDKPLDVSYDAAFWTKAFGGAVDFTEPRYALSGHVESIFSTAPVELNWTLEGVQGKPVERVHSSNGQATTLTILPGMNVVSEKQLFRLKDVNTKHLFKHGNLDMSAELDAVMPLKDTQLMLIDPNRKLGKILKKNEARIVKNADGTPGKLTVVPVINMYAVHEDVLVDVLEALNSQVLSSLKPTDFTKVAGKLSRADRSLNAAATKEFADFSDVPGLTRAGLQAAESAQHSVVINVRLHAIDPSKLEAHK